MLKQKTLRGSFSLNGKGLHTGVNLTVTFNPAPDNHGYKIQRIDLEGQPIIDAVAENVGDTTRGTVLMKNGIKVSTVEHALAALYAAGIDNCLIQVSGPEFPILDGSAKAYDVPASHCFEVRGFELAIYHDASMFPEELGQMDEGQLRGAGNE